MVFLLVDFHWEAVKYWGSITIPNIIVTTSLNSNAAFAVWGSLHPAGGPLFNMLQVLRRHLKFTGGKSIVRKWNNAGQQSTQSAWILSNTNHKYSLLCLFLYPGLCIWYDSPIQIYPWYIYENFTTTLAPCTSVLDCCCLCMKWRLQPCFQLHFDTGNQNKSDFQQAGIPTYKLQSKNGSHPKTNPKTVDSKIWADRGKVCCLFLVFSEKTFKNQCFQQ